MKIGVIAKLTIKAGMNEAFEKRFIAFEKAVHENEDENLFFRLHRSMQDPCSYTVMEQYTNQAAFEAHQNMDYYKAIPETFGEFMDGPPDIEVLQGIS